jgi:hypothetical protein
MWCLYNTKTNLTFARHVQRWTQTRTENDEGVRPFFSVIEGAERVTFPTMDAAAKYAARFDLIATGWSPQPVLPNNVAPWSYEAIECHTCGRRHSTARDANRCACKARSGQRVCYGA